MKKIILIFIIVFVFSFFWWDRIEKEVQTWQDIEKEEIVLKEDIEELTIEDIANKVAFFDNKNYYIEDLNRDGYSEILVISLSEEKSTAHFVLVSVLDKKGTFEKRGSLVLEREFFALPSVQKTKDIKNNNVQEIIVNLNTGGVATSNHAILKWDDGLSFVKVNGEKAIFLVGSSSMHHSLYYLEKEKIIEINAWYEQEEKFCEVKVYQLKDNLFVFDEDLSEEFLEKLGDNCLLDND